MENIVLKFKKIVSFYKLNVNETQIPIYFIPYLFISGTMFIRPIKDSLRNKVKILYQLAGAYYLRNRTRKSYFIGYC